MRVSSVALCLVAVTELYGQKCYKGKSTQARLSAHSSVEFPDSKPDAYLRPAAGLLLDRVPAPLLQPLRHHSVTVPRPVAQLHHYQAPPLASSQPRLPSNPQPAHGSYAVPLDAQGCVAAHNGVRANVGIGPIGWSPALAASASTYAAHLASIDTLVHSGGPYGENLYSGSASCHEAVSMWEAERPAYVGQSLGSGNFHAYGHYSQLVFPSTKAVGCGVAGKYVVCQYDVGQQSGVKLTKY